MSQSLGNEIYTFLLNELNELTWITDYYLGKKKKTKT